LREIIAHCGLAETGGFTVSDFPLAKLNEEKLAQLGSLLNRRAAKADPKRTSRARDNQSILTLDK
jgi:hypothetical protein